MKVLIADDEKFVRYGLKSMLKELYPYIDIKEACNGEEIIEVVKEWHPDIGLIDIKMPKLNGLEAKKIAKDISTKTKWIILTPYSKFSYAKQAITLDTEDYLLKPVKPAKLLETIDKIILKQKNENIIHNKEFENKVSTYFNNIRSMEDIKPLIFKDILLFGLIILFDSYLDEKSIVKLQINFCNHLNKIISEILTDEIRIALITLSTGELVTIAAKDSNEKNNGLTDIKKYFNKLSFLATGFNTSKCNITLLLTEECSSYNILYKEINNLVELSYLRVIHGIGNKIKIIEYIDNKELSVFCNILINISREYKDKAYLNFIKCIDLLKKAFLRANTFIDERIKKSIGLFIKYSFNYKINDFDKKGLSIDKLSKWSEYSLIKSKKEEKQFSNIINEVLTYIDTNYVHDIGIANIAFNLNITPNYLSHLFHKNVGITFIKYLTKIRMLKAKELLMNKRIKVHEVACQVGYFSSTHFTRLFKKYCGCLPSDYQKV